tara:strand:- start:5386 stop:5877 length:492 start_codon:yes stop_codon:yes gene_type:complete
MNARLVITPETRAKLNNPVLSPTKKRELREQLIKDRIRKAAGSGVTKQELIATAGYSPKTTSNEYANGLGLIASMIQRGVISHLPTKGFKKVWSVAEDVKSKREKPKDIDMPLPIISKEATVSRQEPTEINRVKLVDMAKEFAWRKNSDSLREFISYIEDTVK